MPLIAWPRLPSGALALDEATFEEETRNHPRLLLLDDLRVSLARLRLTDIQIGGGGRARCLLSVFRSVTGRNQPSASKFVFGPARWIRGLVREQEGRALARTSIGVRRKSPSQPAYPAMNAWPKTIKATLT